MVLGFFGEGAVVDTVSDVICFSGLVDVGIDNDVNEDFLGCFPFPIVDPDDAAGDQVFDDDFVQCYLLGYAECVPGVHFTLKLAG